MKRTSFILLVMLVFGTLSLYAANPLSDIDKRIYLGLGGCNSLASGSLKSETQIMSGGSLAFMLNKPMSKKTDLTAELQYALRNISREFDHPEPYVFETVADVFKHELRLPLSIIISEKRGARQGLYFGGGISANLNLHSSLIKERHYNDGWPREKTNITKEVGRFGVAPLLRVGLGGELSFFELRYSQDLNGFEIPGFKGQSLKIYDIMLLWGFKIVKEAPQRS